MDGRLTWTDCEEAGDYVVPNVLSPRDLVSRPDNIDETVQHIKAFRMHIIDSCNCNQYWWTFILFLPIGYYPFWVWTIFFGPCSLLIWFYQNQYVVDW